MIPNNVVLASAVVPLREPDSVDVKVRLRAGIRPSQVQAILDHGITTPTRTDPRVRLEEIDGEDVVVRIQATPERAVAGARLADEIIAALAGVTDDHPVARRPESEPERRPEREPALEPEREAERRAEHEPERPPAGEPKPTLVPQRFSR